MKKWIAFGLIFFAVLTVNAQYYDGPDRYFYEEEFDWRWDVRVRISDGINAGYLTNREAKRLYRMLENIERKEWAFMADGHYSPWEQDEIWYDVVSLNRAIGLELTDWDRRYYGYTGVVITGPLRWYFGPSYDFYRFDKRGFGNIRVGYVPRHYYPVKHVYYTKRNNYTVHWNKRPARVVTPSRNNYGSDRNTAPSRASASDRPGTQRSARERTATVDRKMESSRSTERGSSGRVETPRSTRTESPARASKPEPSVNRSNSSRSSSSTVDRSSSRANSGASQRAARSESQGASRTTSSRSRDN